MVKNLLERLTYPVLEDELQKRLQFIGKPMNVDITLEDFIISYESNIKNIQIDHKSNNVILTLINDVDIPFAKKE